MRVLVCGGTAFIGRATTTELLGRGHEVCVVHRGTSEPEELADAHHIHADLRTDGIATVRREIEDFDPDVVWDNIAISRAGAEAVTATCGDRRYVVTSSCDVYKAYGSLHAGIMTEPAPLDETSPVREQRYPYRGQVEGMDDYDKIDVEEVYLARDATVLRLPMVYGPHDRQRREEFILRRVRAGRERIPVGAGTWMGCKGFVTDMARGLADAITSPDVAGQVFNLAERYTYPEGQWAQMILDAAGSPAELVRVSARVLPPDLQMTGSIPQHLIVDTSKARARLAFTDTPAPEALAASVRWHLDHPPEGGNDDFSADDAALSVSNDT